MYYNIKLVFDYLSCKTYQDEAEETEIINFENNSEVDIKNEGDADFSLEMRNEVSPIFNHNIVDNDKMTLLRKRN
jgi:hypothetical protein